MILRTQSRTEQGDERQASHIGRGDGNRAGRGAIQGVPFMPVAGLHGSDLPAARGFQTVADPYSEATVFVVPALVPDVAILHVQEADAAGNGRIIGTRFEDVLMAQAARRVVLTTERIIDGAAFAAAPESVAIPSFLVDTVV